MLRRSPICGYKKSLFIRASVSADTLARMNSDFLYPQIGDRRSIEEWQDAGALTVWDRAHEQVRAILDAPPVAVIASDTSDKVARQFRLPLLGAC